MIKFSNLLGIEKTVLLKENPNAKEVPMQVGIKATPTVIRVDPQELENCYLFDPIAFSAINKITQTIMAVDWKLICKDLDTLDYFNNFIDNVGKVGEDVTFNEILEAIFKNQLIYGNAYVETVFNKKGTEIVDLFLLDPKRMDYAQDASGNILMDKYGKPIGYTLKLPYNTSSEGRGDPIPEGSSINLIENQIFLISERICHFKLYTYGDRFYGLGIIEPAYKTILRKQNIEVAQTNSIDQRGCAPIIDYVGDEFHEPTPQMLEDAAEKLAKFKNNKYFVFPKWHKIETVEIKQSDIVQDTLHYLRENESASLGLPMTFILGSGERSNKYTISSLQRFTENTLNDIVKRTLSTFRKYIFKRMCDLKDFNEIPEISWEDVAVEEPNDKAKRIVEYVQSGIITPKEAHAFAIESEELNKGINEDEDPANPITEDPSNPSPQVPTETPVPNDPSNPDTSGNIPTEEGT